jgi:ZIP family zinc transporter
MNATVGLALLLPTLAGLSTMLGSLLVLFIDRPGPRFMAPILGFSGGVMIFVSFCELLQEGIEQVGTAPAFVAFFTGMLAMYLIDTLVPHIYMAERRNTGEQAQQSKLLRTGLFVAIGIGLHNLPEGIASFASALHDPTLGIAIAWP